MHGLPCGCVEVRGGGGVVCAWSQLGRSCKEPRAPFPCSCAMLIPAFLQVRTMSAKSSSTKTATGLAPLFLAIAEILAAVSTETALLALGHRIMPMKSAPAFAASSASETLVMPHILIRGLPGGWYVLVVARHVNLHGLTKSKIEPASLVESISIRGEMRLSGEFIQHSSDA
jgi:hypothetical protein